MAEERTRALELVSLLRKHTKGMVQPMSVSIIEKFGRDPFLILISCLLSLRAKDKETLPVCFKLFSLAKTPQEVLALSREQLEKILYSIGFYRKKAEILHTISQVLLKKYSGFVPATYEELIQLPGVGPKTANLVLAEGFGVPALCVDIHVHRISNRLGLVATKTPEETEQKLKKILPKDHWAEWNRLLVMWGQNVCVPISPFCSRCAVYDLCKRVGVKKSR